MGDFDLGYRQPRFRLLDQQLTLNPQTLQIMRDLEARMTARQLVNLFLTPDLKPFFGGTYFPPDASFGRPGLKQVLAGIHQAWDERRADIEKALSLLMAHSRA